MRITWVLDGLETDAQGASRSRLASHRYRALLPAEGLRDLGHEVEILRLDDWLGGADTAADAVVIGKHLPGPGDAVAYRTRGEAILTRTRALVARGARVVADFNDDHFDHSLMGPYWRGLAEAASQCIVGSEAMRLRLLMTTGRAATVIGDPVGSPRGTVRVRAGLGRRPGLLARWTQGRRAGDEAVRLLWFGHPVNWAPMQVWLPKLGALAETLPLQLQIVTQPVPAIVQAVEAAQRADEGALALRLAAWDEAVQWAALEACDVVLLPSDPADPRKAVKTANRLTDALHAARPVIASPLPAYEPWAPYVHLTNDPVEALQRWWLDPQAESARVRDGQQAVDRRCSVPVIAEAWADALAAVAAPVSGSAHPANLTLTPGPGVRLNLGCGRRLLDGFVNVDLAQNWSGREPDVVADVTRPLPFPDAHADEVHAYHVLEHLLRWEVEDCLRDWIRVLKPGGRLVLELPCLDKILAIYQSAQAQGVAPPERLTILGLYGDPAYRNEHMLHRWCYSVAELGTVLAQVGLQDIRTEAPQTHIAQRDMRMVGIRPLA